MEQDGGAGNPAGRASSEGYSGENGTGGLLMIYANILENNSLISSNGSAGGAGYRAGAGGSGGGSVNVFYNTINSIGTITATGGPGGAGYSTYSEESGSGAYGGNGSVCVGSIETGTYTQYQ